MVVRSPHLKSGRCALDVLQSRGVSLHSSRFDEGLQSRCDVIHIILGQWFLHDAHNVADHMRLFHAGMAPISPSYCCKADVLNSGNTAVGKHNSSTICPTSLRTVASALRSPSESSSEPFVALAPPHQQERRRPAGIHAVAMRMPPLPPGSSGSAAPSKCSACGTAGAFICCCAAPPARILVRT